MGIFLLSCAEEKSTKYSTDSEKVYLLITENTTEGELTKIASEFKTEKNIMVDFSESRFFENGKIQSLNLKVDCNDDFKGSTKSSVQDLETNNYGFVRNYSDANVPFSIGNVSI